MWHNIQQNTDEWLALRSGKVTGSAISKIMANNGKAFGEPAKALAVDIAVERITGKPSPQGYTNAHMQRGHEQEPLARMVYEDKTFTDVANGGFYDNDLTGCSPDGLVGDDGVVEIKSVIRSVHYKRIAKGGFDPSYRWQLAFNLLQSEREWIDFISYCADFTDDKKLFIYRVYKEDFNDEFNQIKTRLKEFFSLVDDIRGRIIL